MRVRPATIDDASAVAEIYNEAVISSTASFDLEPCDAADRVRWLSERAARHPVVVAEIGARVVGWGALSRFSERPAYQWTAEISVYVASTAHRQGIGRALASDLLARATEAGLHSVVARICTENVASLEMMRSLGFSETGTMHEVGRKFGRWLDVATWEYRVPASGVSGGGIGHTGDNGGPVARGGTP